MPEARGGSFGDGVTDVLSVLLSGYPDRQREREREREREGGNEGGSE